MGKHSRFIDKTKKENFEMFIMISLYKTGFFLLLVMFLVETHSYQPKFKVFEIRKAKDHDNRMDYQYYDPDFTRIESAIHREKDDKKLMRLAKEIINRLHSLSQREKDSTSSESDSGFVDETRSLVVVPSDDVVYHTRPAQENILQKLIQSALRTDFSGKCRRQNSSSHSSHSL
ncbi:uncharacterized protein LOC123871858 isoform X2 [Maniola jurtina]|uniref:uncharacterized protein LOC123871858 isoform X2 n=1 Tax=Maniola jurtina TaxID=191418 RepID=UPI001E68CEC4|nr:uncharacterized protein LOC123871858 isoform X2 [Maniola jurtina]